MKPINFKDAYTPFKPYKIVCFGDSITSATWTFPNWLEIIRYALFTSQALDWEPVLINTGCNNSNTKDQEKLLDSHVLSFNPEIAIYTLSLNDYIYQLPQEEYLKRTTDIVDRLSNKVKEVVICTPPASLNEDFAQGYTKYSNKLVESLRARKDIRFIDIHKALLQIDRSPLYTKTFEYNVDTLDISQGDIDYVHPNELGNAYIAQHILKELFDIALDAEVFMKSVNAGDRIPQLT